MWLTLLGGMLSSRSLGRAALVLGLVGLAVACRRTPASGNKPGQSRHKLTASASELSGASLAPKELVLTFSGGPAPAAVTYELSDFLAARPTPIRATFFVEGACLAETTLPDPSCAAPIADGNLVLDRLVADGHAIGNHTTTGRDLDTVAEGERFRELSDTDPFVSARVPWNRLFFRAPKGAWSADVSSFLIASGMNKYTGPVAVDVGAGALDLTAGAEKGVDVECWDASLTAAECGDLYAAEVRRVAAARGAIVELHLHPSQPYAQLTVDLVKHLVPILEGEGFTFKTLPEVPDIAEALPTCHPSCATCNGAGANACTGCQAGRYLDGGTCETCSTCSGDTYQSAACTATSDTVCSACAACGDGSYVETACGATSNTVCSACDTSCVTCSGPGPTACTSCATKQFLTAGACTACAVCGQGTFQSDACTATTDTVCGSCHPSCTACAGPDLSQCGSCPPSFFLRNDASGSTCIECSTCGPGTYQASACAPNVDTLCVQCPAGTYSEDGTACAACALGTYTDEPGMVVCVPCGACDDGDDCTLDKCEGDRGCLHTPIANCGEGPGIDGPSTNPIAPPPDDEVTIPPKSGCQAAPGGSPRGLGALALAALAVAVTRRCRRRPGRAP